MLRLDFLQGFEEEVFYFILQVHELRAFGTEVLFTKGFNFAPFDFCAVLVEEPTLRLGILAFFTNEPWFSTVRVDTNIFSDIAIGAVGLFFY